MNNVAKQITPSKAEIFIM